MVEITEGDVRKPDTLPAAVADVDVVVSVHDVAGWRDAVLDPALRVRIQNVGGPAALTFNEFAALLREKRGRPTRASATCRAGCCARWRHSTANPEPGTPWTPPT
jgi:uncharacterized protein YbjT (DUF2867 family)